MDVVAQDISSDIGPTPLNMLSQDCVVFKDSLKWHEPLGEFSGLLLLIVLRRKWLIVLNHSDVSNCCCSDLLILSSLWESGDSAILKYFETLQ